MKSKFFNKSKKMFEYVYLFFKKITNTPYTTHSQRRQF